MIKHCVYCSKSDPIEATRDKDARSGFLGQCLPASVTEKSKDCCEIGGQNHISSLGSVIAFMALKQAQ